jgi:hypothetical protein
MLNETEPETSTARGQGTPCAQAARSTPDRDPRATQREPQCYQSRSPKGTLDDVRQWPAQDSDRFAVNSDRYNYDIDLGTANE